MPSVFGNHSLQYAWGYKYESGAKMPGIGAHEDQAAVNLNFWITEDEHTNDPNSGGLAVYDLEAGSGLTLVDFNGKLGQSCVRDIRTHTKKKAVVPHRASRAVLFTSALFNSSASHDFQPGYRSRRIFSRRIRARVER